MNDWYSVNKVVPSNNRTVLVQYINRSNKKVYIGVAKYDKGMYKDCAGVIVDWSVNRVAEDSECVMSAGYSTNENACYGENWGGDGFPLQVTWWKELNN